MRNGITFEISPAQVENLIESLSLQEKLRLVRKLEKETSMQRLDGVAQRMRKSIKRAKISAKTINRICETVKREYDEKHRSN